MPDPMTDERLAFRKLQDRLMHGERLDRREILYAFDLLDTAYTEMDRLRATRDESNKDLISAREEIDRLRAEKRTALEDAAAVCCDPQLPDSCKCRLRVLRILDGHTGKT